MKTEWLRAEQPGDLRRAGELLLAGELVAVPTETVYGLAADATNQDAEVQIMAWAGNLTCSGAQFQGRLDINA